MTRTIIQLYRGTTAQNDAFTGSAGELSFDTTLNQVRVHDGTTVGGHIIGSGSGYHPNLLDWKWADHELNDANWLCADTFSWQPGSTYEPVFNDLFNDIYISTSWRATGYANVYTASPTPEAGDTVYSDSACTTSVGTVTSYDSGNNQMSYNSVTWDYNSNSYVTPASETVAGYTVDVYTGHSGKKIVSWQDESNVASIYSATGVAWYYIIDIANKRFKLPRTKFGFTGLRDTVGDYVAPGLPNVTGSFSVRNNPVGNPVGNIADTSGAFSADTEVSGSYSKFAADANSYTGNTIARFNAHNSNNIYSDSVTTVQSPATQMYLYFYVGNFTQTALENTAGLNASLFNGKADIDASNFNSTGKETIIGWGMPSNSNYDTLTLGASGTQYTAPADGYFFLYAQYSSGSDTSYDMWVVGTGLGYRHWFGTSNVQGAGRGFVPVKKGQKIQIDINGTLGYYDFKFVYADGE